MTYYEDGTFWAIRTEGGDRFTAQGSKGVKHGMFYS